MHIHTNAQGYPSGYGEQQQYQRRDPYAQQAPGAQYMGKDSNDWYAGSGSRTKLTEQDMYGAGYGQSQGGVGVGERSYAPSPYGEQGRNMRSTYQDPTSIMYNAHNVQQPMSGPNSLPSRSGASPVIAPQPGPSGGSSGDEMAHLRKMLSSVTAELGKQISAVHGESRSGDAARAEWLQKLVLQMEAKQALGESDLRDFKSKYSGLHLKLEGQEAENDALREQLARANRGQPMPATAAPSEEQARVTLVLKRENQAFYAQVEEMAKRIDILQREKQHWEKQHENMSAENGNLMLRLQGAEQRTDQLMKQKIQMDEQLHALHAQLASQQQVLAKQVCHVRSLHRSPLTWSWPLF
jgi:hypothetical protein